MPRRIVSTLPLRHTVDAIKIHLSFFFFWSVLILHMRSSMKQTVHSQNSIADSVLIFIHAVEDVFNGRPFLRCISTSGCVVLYTHHTSTFVTVLIVISCVKHPERCQCVISTTMKSCIWYVLFVYRGWIIGKLIFSSPCTYCMFHC